MEQKIHTFEMPPYTVGPDGERHGTPFGVRELDIERYEAIQAEAAKTVPDDAMGSVGSIMAQLRKRVNELLRIACLAEWDGKDVFHYPGGVEGVLDTLGTRRTQMLDRAISKIHDISDEELQAFDASHRQPAAVAMSPRLAVSAGSER